MYEDINPICPNCNQVMEVWQYIRLAGLGVWKDKNTYQSCPKCNKRFDGSEVPEVKEIEGQKGPSVRIQEPNGMRSY